LFLLNYFSLIFSLFHISPPFPPLYSSTLAQLIARKDSSAVSEMVINRPLFFLHYLFLLV
jgi:hypothetical protein